MNKQIKSVRVGTTLINSPIQNIEVYYNFKTDGGGGSRYLRGDFIRAIRALVPEKITKQDWDYYLKHKDLPKSYHQRRIRCLEICSGAGFIGFDLLSRDDCQELVLADINAKAIEVCNLTISKNPEIKEFVKTYVSDCFDAIPKTEKFDLIVGNPPHFFTDDKKEWESNKGWFDYKWQFHQKFYRQAKNYLSPNGRVILLENEHGSKPEDFLDMINNSELVFVKSFKAGFLARGVLRYLFGNNPYYYIHSELRKQ